jgi:hypothetical protein
LGGPPRAALIGRAGRHHQSGNAELRRKVREHGVTEAAIAESLNERWLAYEAANGERIEGIYRRPLELASGRYAVIERSREFALMSWRPVLEHARGRGRDE